LDCYVGECLDKSIYALAHDLDRKCAGINNERRGFGI
jgi:hypothetical protein